MTPDKDGWIKHDGGPCPVDPETWVHIMESDFVGGAAYMARDYDWGPVVAYRIFAPVTPGPSPFVRDTAARIMVGFAAHPDYMADPHADWAAFAVRAALALEAELGRIGK